MYAKLVEALGLGTHLYADDTQLYGHCFPPYSVELASRVQTSYWHQSTNGCPRTGSLSITSKTQFIWLGTKHSLAIERYRSPFQSIIHPWPNLSSVKIPWFHHWPRTLHEKSYYWKHLPVVLLPAVDKYVQFLAFTYTNCHPNLVPCFRLHTHSDFRKQQSSMGSERVPPVTDLPSIGPRNNLNARLILKIGKYDPISSNNYYGTSIGFAIRFRVHVQAQFHHEFNCLQLVEHRSTCPSSAIIREWHSSSSAQPSVRHRQAPMLLVPRFRKERSGRKGMSPFPHHSYGICFLSISRLHRTAEHQLFRRRLKTYYMQQSLLRPPEDLCHQCELYYYYYYYYIHQYYMWYIIHQLTYQISYMIVYYDWSMIYTIYHT